MMRDTRLCTAIHEAAHAVAQLADPPANIRGLEIRKRNDRWIGKTSTSPLWHRPMNEDVSVSEDNLPEWADLARREVVRYLAGFAAEMRWRSRSRRATRDYGPALRDKCFSQPNSAGDDLFEVHKRLTWAFPDDPTAEFDRAWLDTENLVARHWYAIEQLGRLLADRGSLECEEIALFWRRLPSRGTP